MSKQQKTVRMPDGEVCNGGSCRFPRATAEMPEEHAELTSHNMSDITWRIFRIMAEFVEGFQFLTTTFKEVSIFGSARINENSPWYKEVVKLGKILGDEGFTVITGGGPGMMEAANRGAFEAGAPSLGLNIQLPTEQRVNPFVTRSKAFYYFFTRKVMLTASGQAYVFCPGGFGTLDEFSEILTLIQTDKMSRVPCVLLSHAFWDPMVAWMRKEMRDEFETISPEDLDLFTIVDTAEEAMDIIRTSKERTIF
ncbi:MAG: TIGR00730 family Rossman fold protein [Patescibacteria group bacterium]